MIVVPGKFVYVGAPRTGSHFIYNVLEAHFPDAVRSEQHHASIGDVLNAKRMGGGLPVYTVVREPVKHLFSFYWNSLRKYPGRIVTTTFEEFIEGRKPPNAPYKKALEFPPGALNTYRNVADKFFPFEADFSTLMKELNVDNTHGVVATRLPTEDYIAAQKQITEADKRLIRKYFKRDYELYKSMR